MSGVLASCVRAANYSRKPLQRDEMSYSIPRAAAEASSSLDEKIEEFAPPDSTKTSSAFAEGGDYRKAPRDQQGKVGQRKSFRSGC